METGGDLSQSVSARSGRWREQGPESLRCLLLLQVSGPHLFADARLQQAVRWNGAVPEQSVQAGLHRKHHTLKQKEIDR